MRYLKVSEWNGQPRVILVGDVVSAAMFECCIPQSLDSWNLMCERERETMLQIAFERGKFVLLSNRLQVDDVDATKFIQLSSD